MQTTSMIHPGARIGVAVSGGVDSWVLLNVLHLRQRIVPFKFEIMALHINPGFDPENHAPLLEWLEREGVAGHVELSDHGLVAHGRKIENAPPVFIAPCCAANGFLICAAITT